MLATLPTTRMCVPILTLTECALNLHLSLSKASTRTFIRIPSQQSSNLLMVVMPEKLCLLLLCLSNSDNSTLLSPSMQVPMTQTIGLSKFHFLTDSHVILSTVHSQGFLPLCGSYSYPASYRLCPPRIPADSQYPNRLWPS